jgi:hypothetical protein
VADAIRAAVFAIRNSPETMNQQAWNGLANDLVNALPMAEALERLPDSTDEPTYTVRIPGAYRNVKQITLRFGATRGGRD